MWKEYFEKTRNSPPNDLLLKALPYVDGKDALDLGAGALRDSKHLAKHGFFVVSVDSAVEFLNQQSSYPRINLIQGTFKAFFEEYQPKEEFDLVNAQWALSFASRSEIEPIIECIYKSLKKGGIFTGNIFGIEDAWNEGQDTMSFLTKDEVNGSLAGMEDIYFAEVYEKKPSAVGQMKDWHYYEFILQK